jgi:hypothetical protein
MVVCAEEPRKCALVDGLAVHLKTPGRPGAGRPPHQRRCFPILS